MFAIITQIFLKFLMIRGRWIGMVCKFCRKKCRRCHMDARFFVLMDFISILVSADMWIIVSIL